MINRRYGRLTVLAYDHTAKGHAFLRTVCDCGNMKIVQCRLLKNGHVKSCGCLALVHGLWGTKTYHAWDSMLGRCLTSSHASFHHYGGRGITVCDQWRTFTNFVADMGECPVGLSLDRIDVNGNYEPQNCRWATAMEQANNRRNNRYVEYQGRRITISQMARELGVSYHVLAWRLRRGWKPGDPVKTGPYCTLKRSRLVTGGGANAQGHQGN